MSYLKIDIKVCLVLQQKGLDCCMSSSIALCEMTDNKVWTRSAMATVGINVPYTLAFCYKTKHKLFQSEEHITAHMIDTIDHVFAEKEIRNFLKSERLKDTKRVCMHQYISLVTFSFNK